jgi:integration host factor subunit beta
MVRSELIQKLAAERPDLQLETMEAVVDAVFDAITDTLARGGRVEIRGFGAFVAKTRQARTGRNPRTGDAVAITEKRVPTFRAGKGILARLNEKL